MNADLSYLRPRMMSVAYRMLGSIADAEDAVQDAFLRLHAADQVTSPEGFLVRATTRRCIDQLRSDKRRKEYIGPWVPEPIDTKNGGSNADLAQSLSQAFLLMLERLAPEERAAFLLRIVFDYEYAEIAEVLGKSQAAVRQMVSRARERVRLDRPRFQAAPQEADGLAERFVHACRAGDVKRVEEMLTEEVEVHSDGGGRVSAARLIVRGRNKAARFLAAVFSKRRKDCVLHKATVNGEPGVVFTIDGAVIQVASLSIENGVRAIYMTSNPDKLSRWSLATVE